MIVKVKKSQLDWFRAKARNTPNEIFAFLAGKQVTPHIVEIYKFFYPELAISNPSEVEAENKSCLKIESTIHDMGCHIVGDIHSHPNWPPIMSDTDHKGHITSGNRVSGIVEVTNRRTRVAFWRHDSSLHCKLEYF